MACNSTASGEVNYSDHMKKMMGIRHWQRQGPATAVQVLDELGVLEKPGDLAR
jgi:hypothetical protein